MSIHANEMFCLPLPPERVGRSLVDHFQSLYTKYTLAITVPKRFRKIDENTPNLPLVKIGQVLAKVLTPWTILGI